MNANSNRPATTSPACQCGVQPHGNAVSIRNPQSAIRNGFTLLELITVIIIILLLAGLLMPTIIKAKSLAQLANTRAYITQLESGALRYKQENQVFPGQDDPGIMTGAYPHSFTGSQVLGAALFGVSLNTTNGYVEYLAGSNNVPTSPYVQYDDKRVMNSLTGNDTNEFSFAPRDLFSDNDISPILYYPSILGNDGSIDNSFNFTQNEDYTGNINIASGTDSTTKNLIGIVWDTRFGRGANQADDNSHKTTWGTNLPDTSDTSNKAFNADSFLLFGKGVNNRDQTYSWFTPQSAKNFTSEGYKVP